MFSLLFLKRIIFDKYDPWLSKLHNVEVYEGDTAEFSFKVKSEDAEVSWFVNGRAVVSGDKYDICSDGIDQRLVIKETKLADNGSEIKVIVDGNADIVHLVVKEIHLRDVTVYEGGNAEFTFEVFHEELEAFWFVNNLEAIGERYEVSSVGLVRKLVVKDTKRPDDGTTVSVRVNNQDISAQLSVKGSHFTTQISDVTVPEGDSAVYICEVRNASDTVRWFVNGNAISDNDRYIVTTNGTRRTLRIRQCTMFDNETQVYVNISDEKRVAWLYVEDLKENKIRWQAVGEALNTVLCPRLRKYICHEMNQLYQIMESSQNISSQCCPPTCKHHNGKTLNYQTINGNERHGKQFIRNTYNSKYDFTVKTPVDLAKLFLESHMSHMTGFDDTCDISAALNIITGSGLSATKKADQVKTEVRNPWGHFNCREWSQQKLQTSFSLMRDLFKQIGLSNTEERDCLKELDKLENKGRVDKKINDRIPVHIKEQFDEIIDEWIVDDEMFVSTKAAEEVMTQIKKHNFVVATGNSGTGKTYTVRHTALMMKKAGYVIVPAVGPEDISKYFKHGCKTVFVFDDLCGRFTLNQNYLDQWKLHKQNLKTILKDSSCKILASCRLQVSRETKMKAFFTEIQSEYECKMGSRSLRLSIDERRKIVQKYFNPPKMTITDEKLSEFDFLPFLCSVLKSKDISELEKCFQNPFSFFKEELEKLYQESDEGKLKYCALLLCVLYNNTLTQNALKQKDTLLKSIFTDVLEECELASTEPLSKMQKALQSLNDVYIAIADGTYIINHDKLFDYMAKYFGEKIIDVFIKFADPDFIRERFCIEGRKASKMANDCIHLPDDKLQTFIERLVNDWKWGEVKNVFCNTNMESAHFRHLFLSYLNTLDECTQKELVNARDNTHGESPLLMVCFIDDLEFTSWLLCLGADVNLGCNNRSTPLQAACFYNNVEVVKILLTHKHTDIDRRDINGRTALFLACEQGNLEIARLLIQFNADLNISDKYQITPFDVACINGHYKVVGTLMQCNVDVNKSIPSGSTPLMLACLNNHLEVVNLLLTCEHTEVNQRDNNGSTALHLACKRGNLEIVTEIIPHTIDINMCDVDGQTPLMIACLNNQINVVKIILNCTQIKVNHSTKSGDTALHLACMIGNVEIITELLQHDVNINSCNVNGMTPLMYACICSDLDTVIGLLKSEQTDVGDSTNTILTALLSTCLAGNLKKVIERIQDNENIDMVEIGFTITNNHLEVVQVLLTCKNIDINVIANDGSTALHLACMAGNAEIVSALIQRHVDINSSQNDGYTPLMLALTHNHLEVATVLLQRAKIDVKHSSKDGRTAIHLASMTGNTETVSELMRRHVDINSCGNDGYTPLMLALKHNHLEVVKILLQGKEVDVKHSSKDGRTAFHLACMSGNAETVSELIRRCVDINSCENDGFTPLMLALKHNKLEVVKIFMQCEKVDVKHSSKDGMTAIHLASIAGNEEIVSEVIRRHVDINISDNDGWTPLMLACLNNQINVVKIILNCGEIKVNHSSKSGDTALHLACMIGNIRIVNELLQHDVNINSCNVNGMTPLMYACICSDLDTVIGLLRRKHTDVGNNTNDSMTALFSTFVTGTLKKVIKRIQNNENMDMNETGNFTITNNHLEVVQVLLMREKIDINVIANDGSTILHLACMAGNAEIVSALIQRHADINSINNDGYTPLMLALKHNHQEVVKVLLQRKQIDVKHSSKDGMTAVHLASMTGNTETVSELIRRHVDINISENDGWTPLMLAFLNNQINVVKIILNCGEIKVNHSSKSGDTALHLACMIGNIGIVNELLQHDVNINSCNVNGITPLMYACISSDFNIVLGLMKSTQTDVNDDANDGLTALLSSCVTGILIKLIERTQSIVDIDMVKTAGFTLTNGNLEVVQLLLKCEKIDIKQSANDGSTALHFACIAGNAEIVTELVKTNSDINQTKEGGLTPLMLACCHNRINIIRILLVCKHINISHSDNNGSTALHFACEKGNVQIVTELIQRHIDINSSDKNGYTPLMIACDNNHLEVVKALLKCEQIDAQHSDNNGWTALHVACRKGNVEIVNELIQRQADINNIDKNGITPLMIACDQDLPEVVKALTKCEKIDGSYRDTNGWTALHYASRKGSVEIVTELIQCKLDINKSEGYGWTPLMLACFNNHLEVVKELLKCDQIDINHSGNDGMNGLHLACRKGNVEIVTELLKCKHIDINHLDSNGRTAFYWACHSGHLELVRLLITSGVDINQTSTDNSSRLECDHDNKDELQKFLSDRSKNVKQSDESDGTFTFYSCQLGHPKVVQEISRCPRPIYACRKDGWFPLLDACDENQIEVVRELIRCPDIKLDQCNSCGQTTLYWACVRSHVDVIAELIKQGVDVNKADINKLSPLHVACMARNKVTVKLLIDNGAKTDVRNNEGMAPLDIATAENDRDIIEILKGNSNPTSQ